MTQNGAEKQNLYSKGWRHFSNNQPDTVDHGLRIGGQGQELTQQDRLDGSQKDVGRAAQKYRRIAVKQAGQALQ